MNKQYSFKDRENEFRDLTAQRNWTDERVMQIMKKYQKPPKNVNPTTCQITLPSNKISYQQPSYIKEELWKKDQTPLGEHNYNADNSYRLQDFSTKKWKNDEQPYRGEQNTYKGISKSIDLMAPQHYSEDYIFR